MDILVVGKIQSIANGSLEIFEHMVFQTEKTIKTKNHGSKISYFTKRNYIRLFYFIQFSSKKQGKRLNFS